MSWLCVPCSTTSPFLKHTMLSALRIVERRCATTITVRPFMRLSRALCTIFSLALSSALVASSSSRILGSDTMARAIAMRCFCPPLSCVPRSPAIVSSLSGSFEMNCIAFALCAASAHSCTVAFSFPYRMFSSSVVAKRTGSCDTSPRDPRSHFKLSFLRLFPSKNTPPPLGSGS
mmetsp:Transcript_66118/g.162771  ORF Transcript_66118/g.162771 Transcript_66118/m.162771 type:complete len:175 (+) Transcript_66118:114-638(+)